MKTLTWNVNGAGRNTRRRLWETLERKNPTSPCFRKSAGSLDGFGADFVFNPFPIPRPERESERWQRVVRLAGRLACPDERFAAWAETVGVECGPLAADEKEDKIHELDAVVSHLYGLKEAQVVHIFKTFHEGWDFEERLRGVLRHCQAWNNRQ